MRIKLSFGGMAPTISQQLADQGIAAHPKDVKHWQKDADAITRLCIRAVLSDSTGHAARRRLMREIAAGCRRSSDSGGSHG